MIQYPKETAELVTYLRKGIEREEREIWKQITELGARYVGEPERAEIWRIEEDHLRAQAVLRTYHMRLEIAHINRHSIDYIPPAPIEVPS